MRKPLVGLMCIASLLGCDEGSTTAEPAPPSMLAAGEAYANDIAFARAALEASIVDPTNGYSARRLANYTAEGWGALPVLPARVAPIFVGEPPGAFASLPDAPAAWTDAGVRALGEAAFYRWPGQIVEGLRPLLDDPEALRRVGLVPGPDGSLPLVWIELASGPNGPRIYPALTCATCHAHRDADGTYTPGRPSTFNYSGIFGSDWGPGRVDVTGDGVSNPTAVTDLRPLRFQQYLHKAATLQNDPIALAVRAETLMITSSRESWRPSRAMAFGLAYYFWSFADDLPPIPTGAGRAVFDAYCAGCHAGDAMTSTPKPIDAIGTPDAVGRSPSRGTGTWRVPSLRGVGTRGQLFSAGDVPDLQTLLDPDRLMPGHRFGLDLDDADRAALLAFLQAL